VSILLLPIYLAKQFKDSLIFLELEERCFIEPWSDTGWKFPSHTIVIGYIVVVTTMSKIKVVDFIYLNFDFSIFRT